jgi:hypothetical protein
MLVLASRSAAHAGPTPIVLSSTADTGPNTLREAIASANNSPGPDIINFDPGTFPEGNPATISVTTPLPVVDDTSPITIDGTGAGVILDGAQLSGGGDNGLVFTAGGGPGDSVRLKAIVVQNFPGAGVVFNNDGPLDSIDIESVVIQKNGVVGLNVETGQSIDSITLKNAVVINNSGGGILIHPGGSINSTTISNVVSNDNGDASFVLDPGGDANDVSLDGLVSVGNGAEGVLIHPGGSLNGASLKNVIANNSAAAGLVIHPSLDVNNIAIQGLTAVQNAGDGLEIGGASIANLVITTATANQNENGIVVTSQSTIDGLGVSAVITSGNVDTGFLVQAAGTATRVSLHDNIFSQNVNGISLHATGSGSNLLTHNRVEGNSGDGIKVLGGDGWTISRNSSAGNSILGIDLVVAGDGPNGVTPNDAGDGDDGPNTALNSPEFALAGGTTGDITGTACRGCTIEFFIASLGADSYGDGYQFLGSTFADVQGQFAFQLCGVFAGARVTATATDSADNTSEFAHNYVEDETTPDCHHINGDLDCNLAVDARDALLAIVHDSGATDLGQEEGCPQLGSEVTAPASVAPAASITFGDANCDGHVDTSDATRILRYVAQLPAESSTLGRCPAIGD